MVEKEVKVQFRPREDVSVAALVVQKAAEFRSQIHFADGNRKVNGKSIMGMMTMPFTNGQILLITAEGPDETEAINALEEFLSK